MKRVLFLSIFLCTSFFSIAQEHYKWGLAVGGSYNRLMSTTSTEDLVHIGGQLGAYYRRMLTDEFWIQPELYYAAKGGNMNITNLNETSGRLDLMLHYVQFPILFGHQSTSGFYLFAGPYVSRLLAVGAKLKSGDLADVDQINTSTLNSTDYGLQAGFGWSFESGLQLNLRINTALRELETDSTRALLGASYNTNLQLMIGYHF